MSPRAFSRIVGTPHIGARFFHRVGLVAADRPAPPGLVDRLEDLAPEGTSLARVPAAVRAFFEDTASLDLHVRSRWHPLARLAWRALRPLFVRVGQLALPLDAATVRTTMLALDAAREGRDGVRGVVRTMTPGDAVFQVFAYSVEREADEARMSVAIPWPLGHLAGKLRLDVHEAQGEGPASVTLTSRRRRRSEGVGVWFVRGRLALRLPLDEALRLWSADAEDAPVPRGAREWSDATVVARHTQRLFGLRVVEHTYLFRPRLTP